MAARLKCGPEWWHGLATTEVMFIPFRLHRRTLMGSFAHVIRDPGFGERALLLEQSVQSRLGQRRHAVRLRFLRGR